MDIKTDNLDLTVEQHEVSEIPELGEADLASEVPDSGEFWGRTFSSKRKEIPEGLWDRCSNCEETVYVKQRRENMQLCPKCGFHYPMSAPERIELLSDKGSFREIDHSMKSVDTLKFEGVASYTSKLSENEKKTALNDAVVCGLCTLDEKPYALGVMDFRFLGASMGSVVGEKITRLTERATAEKIPLVLVTASGGARMYEGMLSLMQMAKTSAALQRHAASGLPYIVVMTHPTYAGVTASFASLGDLIVAEPYAMIGFAGPRVIKDTTQSQLPEGFQSSEFLLKKGLIDRIIERKSLRTELSLILDFFGKSAGMNVSKHVDADASASSKKATKKAKTETENPLVKKSVTKKAESVKTPSVQKTKTAKTVNLKAVKAVPVKKSVAKTTEKSKKTVKTPSKKKV